MARLDDLLRQMKQQGASDLHLTSGSAPFMRIHGEMMKQSYRSVSAESCQSLIFEILTEKQKQIFTENWDLDLSYPLPGVGRFRVNVFMHRHGIAAAFRLIPETIKTISELDLPEQLASLIDASEGRSEEHTSELQSQSNLVCRLLLEKKKQHNVDMC